MSFVSQSKSVWILTALFVFALVFFSRSYSSYFVCDDFLFLERVNFENAGEYFTKSWGHGNEYRPVLPFSYALDGKLSGNAPMGYHLTNTLLHAGNASLVFLLATWIGLSLSTASLAGFIYLLNPVAHESVLWISGRPVVLSTFFLLAACALFLRGCGSQSRVPWRQALAYASFLLALGTYEGAIVAPVLVGIVCYLGGCPPRRYRAHIFMLFVITAIYVLSWNWLFDFTITRFPVERSISGAVTSFGQAMLRSFHGIARIEVAVLYLAALIPFWITRYGRSSTLMALLWFLSAYMPFFIVTGFADRFAYVSSIAVAALLALAICAQSRPKLRVASALLLLCFFGIGTQNRITDWKEAGEIARSIPADIKESIPELPASDRTLILLDVPLVHKRAYVYLTGLTHAIEREYPDAPVTVMTQLNATVDEDSIIFRYVDGRMRRTTYAEITAAE